MKEEDSQRFDLPSAASACFDCGSRRRGAVVQRSECLIGSGGCGGPISMEGYLTWRKGAGDVPLARQRQAVIAATGQSHSVAQVSGVAFQAAPLGPRCLLPH